MTTAVAEPPAAPATTTPEPMVPLADAFAAALKDVKAKRGEEPSEPVQKQETPTPEAKPEPTKAKEPEAPKDETKEPAKEDVKPEKKKSALDAALEEPASPKSDDADGVEKLIATDNPGVKALREALKKQNEEFKAFREQAKKTTEQPPEYAEKLKAAEAERDQAREQLSKYKDAVVELDVRLDPEFRAKQDSRNKQVESLAARVAAAGGDADAFAAAMALPIEKRSKALDAALNGIESQRDQAAINAKLGQIEVLDESIAETLAKPQESYEQMRQRQELAEREHQAQRQKLIETTFDKVRSSLPKLSRFMRPAPEDAEGAAEYNAQLQQDLDGAVKALAPETPEQAAELSFKAKRYDSLEKLAAERFAKDATRIAELEEQVAKYEGAQPGFRGGKVTNSIPEHERPIADVYNDALNAKRATI